MKNIHWLIPRKINNSDLVVNDGLASIRLRCALFNNQIFNQYKINYNEKITNLNNVDFLFVGKFVSKREDLFNLWSEYISEYRKKNKPIFFDYTDHHFQKKNIVTEFYEKNINRNDYIVVSSAKLKEHIAKQFTNLILIEDPYEVDIMTPENNNNNTFLFFGNAINLKYLVSILSKWDDKKEYTLIILSSLNGLRDLVESHFRNIKILKNLKIRLVPWSIENLKAIAKSVSGIIIPGDVNDNLKNGVSHNRLITSFALGLPVAATKYNSYLEFENFFADIDNQDAFRSFLQNPLQYSNKITKVQEKIKQYSKENLARKWFELIDNLKK